MPLLHPDMGRFGSVDDLFARNILLVASGDELQKVDSLLCIELSSQDTGRNELGNVSK